MGSHEHPVNLWHWRAARMIDTAGVLDLIEALPHVMMHPVYRESRLDVAPLYVPAPSSAISGGRLKELSAETFGDVRDLERENGAPVGASARWNGGEWSLVLTRSLAGPKPGEVSFEPGQQVLFSSAVWNGSSGDHGGAKSISIWQQLVLD